MNVSVNHDSSVKDINFTGGGGIGDINISTNKDINIDRINNPINVSNSKGPNLSISDSKGLGGGDMFGMDLLSNKGNDKGGGYDSGHESDRSYTGSERSMMSDRSHKSQN